MITEQHIEIVRIIGLTVIGITFMICWTWLRVANKKYKKEK